MICIFPPPIKVGQTGSLPEFPERPRRRNQGKLPVCPTLAPRFSFFRGVAMRPEGSSLGVIHCDLNYSLRNSAGIIANKYAGSRLRLPIVEKTAKPCPSFAQTLQCRAQGIRLARHTRSPAS